MKKNQKVFRHIIGGLFITILMVLGVRNEVSAANIGVTDLKANKTYKMFDLDGDKKKDKIKLKITRKGNEVFSEIDANIRINGKVVYRLPRDYRTRAGLRIITLKNGKNLIYFWSEDSQLVADDIIFQYEKGKIKEIVDFQAIKGLQKYNHGFFLDKNYFDNAITVSGNTLKVKLNTCNWSVGVTELELVYQYKKTSYNLKPQGIYKKRGIE